MRVEALAGRVAAAIVIHAPPSRVCSTDSEAKHRAHAPHTRTHGGSSQQGGHSASGPVRHTSAWDRRRSTAREPAWSWTGRAASSVHLAGAWTLVALRPQRRTPSWNYVVVGARHFPLCTLRCTAISLTCRGSTAAVQSCTEQAQTTITHNQM